MEAGEGARRQAELAARSVEEARRKLAEAERRQRAWEAGAEGERRTAEVLADLTDEGWLVLHDLHWPGRACANIDHIAVGAGGVLVIDSKNWSGRVEVRAGVLRQNGYQRTREYEAAAQAAAAVAAWLEPRHRKLVEPVICLVGQDVPTARLPTGVVVCGLTSLPATLRARSVRLAPVEVQAVTGYLRRLLSRERSPGQLTTASLDAAGPAPREASARARQSASFTAPGRLQPGRGSRPRSGPRKLGASARSPRAGSRSRPGPAPNSTGIGVTKLLLILFLLLVVVPQVLPR